MTVTYTRDARGLVTRVTDSLTGAQVDIEYNKDRQMTKITRSNGIATDYSYDEEGKIAQIVHGTLGTIDFAFTAANEPAAITDSGFPLDPGTFVTAAAQETQSFDDANQLTSGGYAYDPRGRPTTDGTRTFRWDSADRLTGVVNGPDTLTYDYTATGEISSRTHNGQITEYSYAYSVATQPILAERKNGSFARFYIALPDGRILYQIDLSPTPVVRFYHFGKVGETKLLTDAAGAVTDAYAYDGFGRLLGQTGTSDQIYAFTGELGVRHDPEAALVHMRARHYDPASGRFLSPDPIHLALMGRNGQHANPYHFVEGMPTWVVDPSGLIPQARRERAQQRYERRIRREIEAPTLGSGNERGGIEVALAGTIKVLGQGQDDLFAEFHYRHSPEERVALLLQRAIRDITTILQYEFGVGGLEPLRDSAEKYLVARLAEQFLTPEPSLLGVNFLNLKRNPQDKPGAKVLRRVGGRITEVIFFTNLDDADDFIFKNGEGDGKDGLNIYEGDGGK